MAPKVTVYLLNNSRALRILWLLEELQLDYTVEKYQRNSENYAPESLKQIHPLGRSPIVKIEEDGKKPIIMVESGAITEYLIQAYGKSTTLGSDPSNAEEYAEYLQWMHYAEGSIMTPCMIHLVFMNVKKQAPMLLRSVVNKIVDATMSQYIQPRLDLHFQYVDQHLKSAPEGYFVGGRLTGADIMMSFPCDGNPDKSKYPALIAYLEKLKSRPQYKAAVAKAGGDLDLQAFAR